MEHSTRGVHISAGDGIVAHVSNLTAYASGEESRLNELLVRLNALAGEPWQEIVRSLTSGITDAGYTDHPALACVSVENDKVAALVFGDTALSVIIDGAETVLDGRDSSTWIDVALRGSVDRVHAGRQSDSAVVGVLRDGVVPAGGFLLDTSGPIPASGSWSELANSAITADEVVEEVAAAPTSEAPAEVASAPVEDVVSEVSPTESEDASESTHASRSMFARIEEIGRATQELRDEDGDASPEESTSADEGASPDAPAPVVDPDPALSAAAESAPAQASTLAPQRPQLKGVLCTAGHLTAPLETTCRSCGEPVEAGAALATGDRPVLGTLTFDDGAVLNIDRPAAVGADVPAGYVVDDEAATIVRLDDGVGGVSALQLEVRLSGWNVEIVDMDSENGTYTMLRGERQTRTKLRANQAVVLQPEMEVQTGGRSFVYSAGPAQ